MLTRLLGRQSGTAAARIADVPDPCACAVVMESRFGQAYNQEAFRYFVAVERRASERSPRPVLLLLVGLRRRSGMSARVDPAIAAQLFSALWQCLRETDVVGWFREGRVAGALLTQLAGSPGVAGSRIQEKVRAALGRTLPPEVAGRLRIRVCHLPPRPRDRS